MANLLLSALGRLFTSFLQLRGFTLGVEDILVLPEVCLSYILHIVSVDGLSVSNSTAFTL